MSIYLEKMTKRIEEFMEGPSYESWVAAPKKDKKNPVKTQKKRSLQQKYEYDIMLKSEKDQIKRGLDSYFTYEYEQKDLSNLKSGEENREKEIQIPKFKITKQQQMQDEQLEQMNRQKREKKQRKHRQSHQKKQREWHQIKLREREQQELKQVQIKLKAQRQRDIVNKEIIRKQLISKKVKEKHEKSKKILKFTISSKQLNYLLKKKLIGRKAGSSSQLLSFSQPDMKIVKKRQPIQLFSMMSESLHTCPFCLSIYVHPLLLECGHILCLQCFQICCIQKPRCPLCRTDITCINQTYYSGLEQWIKQTVTPNSPQGKEYWYRQDEFDRWEERRRYKHWDQEQNPQVDCWTEEGWKLFDIKRSQIRNFQLYLNVESRHPRKEKKGLWVPADWRGLATRGFFTNKQYAKAEEQIHSKRDTTLFDKIQQRISESKIKVDFKKDESAPVQNNVIELKNQASHLELTSGQKQVHMQIEQKEVFESFQMQNKSIDDLFDFDLPSYKSMSLTQSLKYAEKLEMQMFDLSQDCGRIKMQNEIDSIVMFF